MEEPLANPMYIGTERVSRIQHTRQLILMDNNEEDVSLSNGNSSNACTHVGLINLKNDNTPHLKEQPTLNYLQ